jgi:cell division protein FtsN
MKKPSGNTRALETFRVFPYIAWACIIAFAFMVYSMTIHLKAATTELRAQTAFTEAQAKTNPTQIKSFEPTKPVK